MTAATDVLCPGSDFQLVLAPRQVLECILGLVRAELHQLPGRLHFLVLRPGSVGYLYGVVPPRILGGAGGECMGLVIQGAGDAWGW